MATLEPADPRGHGRARPGRRPRHHRRDPRRAPAARRPRSSPATCSTSTLATPTTRGFRTELICRASEGDAGGFREVSLRGQGPGRLLGVQARGRRSPRAAGPGHREPGSHPHLDRDRGGDARGRRRRGARRPQRPQDRRLPLQRPRRPERQHDRLGRAHHPPADRDRRLDPGREEPAAEPGAGHAGAARPALRAASSRSSSGAVARTGASSWDRATARRRSAPTTTRRTASPTTASTSRSRCGSRCSRASSTRITDALQAEERRLRLADMTESAT